MFAVASMPPIEDGAGDEDRGEGSGQYAEDENEGEVIDHSSSVYP